MVTTCGFEEAKENDPHKFDHMRQFNALERLRIRMLKCHSSSIIATFQSRPISREDFDSLAPGIPIASGVLDFTFTYLQNLANSSPNGGRVMLIGSQACNRVILGDVPDLTPILGSKSFTFFPIECPDGDWSLLVLFGPHGKAFYYNIYSECQQGLFLVNGIIERAELACGHKIELVELNAPNVDHRTDSGVLICEITALLVRRLIQAKPSHRLSLGLGGTSFIIGAGRTMIQTLIMSLFQNIQQSGIGTSQALEIYPLKPPRSSSHSHSIEAPAQESPPLDDRRRFTVNSAEEVANKIWLDVRRNSIQELSKEAQGIPQAWWVRRSQEVRSVIK